MFIANQLQTYPLGQFYTSHTTWTSSLHDLLEKIAKMKSIWNFRHRFLAQIQAKRGEGSVCLTPSYLTINTVENHSKCHCFQCKMQIDSHGLIGLCLFLCGFHIFIHIQLISVHNANRLVHCLAGAADLWSHKQGWGHQHQQGCDHPHHCCHHHKKYYQWHQYFEFDKMIVMIILFQNQLKTFL